MTDITTLRRFICYNNRCGKKFHADGDQRIGSVVCPHCSSPNIDTDEFSRPGSNGDSHRIASETLTNVCPKKLIVKIYEGIKNFYPLYFISSADTDNQPIGTITPKGLEAMNKENLLTEIPHTEIIENFYRHKWLMSDVKTSRYYELKTKI